MPAWLRLDVADGAVRRGDAVRLRWDCEEPGANHELRLALVVHHRIRVTTLELDVPGQFGAERQAWAVHDRAPLAGGEGRLRVPGDAPYSYPGTVLAFFWGIALARPDDPDDGVTGWHALRVAP
jgi:hypothetical protein